VWSEFGDDVNYGLELSAGLFWKAALPGGSEAPQNPEILARRCRLEGRLSNDITG
jgi:hypothetical protein